AKPSAPPLRPPPSAPPPARAEVPAKESDQQNVYKALGVQRVPVEGYSGSMDKRKHIVGDAFAAVEGKGENAKAILGFRRSDDRIQYFAVGGEKGRGFKEKDLANIQNIRREHDGHIVVEMKNGEERHARDFGAIKKTPKGYMKSTDTGTKQFH